MDLVNVEFDKKIQEIAGSIRNEHFNEENTIPRPKDPGMIEEGCDFPISSPDWPFNQLSVDYSILGCAEIETVDASHITPFFFYKNYVAKNRPVIINNLMTDWPAMTLWQHDAYLLSKIGDTDVTIDYTPDGRADAIVNNGNYPIIQKERERQLKLNQGDDKNGKIDKIDQKIPIYTTDVPTGLYSDLFAVPHSKTIKFREFLPYLSHYPEMVYNHPHRDLELEYLYSLYQFNSQNDPSKGTTQNTQNTPQNTTKNSPLSSSEFLKTLPPKGSISTISDISASLTSFPNYTPGIPYCQRQNSSFQDEFSNLHSDIPIDGFSWANECFDSNPAAVNIWMGSSFSHTSLHQDWFENIYCVVEGMKQFVLVPPSEVYWLRKKNLPTVKWALVKNQDKREEISNKISNKNGVNHFDDKEILLQTDNKGRKYYHLESPQPLQTPPIGVNDEGKNDQNDQNDQNNTTSEKSAPIYRFYVVDRTTGDNAEYYELDDLLTEQQEYIEEKRRKSDKNDHHEPSVDFSYSNRPYLITDNHCLHIEEDNQQQSTQNNTNNTELSDVLIYPLVMVLKGSYVTVPCFSSKPNTYTYPSDSNNDDNGGAKNSENQRDPTVIIHTIPSKLNSKEEYLQSIYKDFQVTPWIDIDVEVNPLNFTPGTTRSRHQHTNSNILRYIATVKKGQTLYLPRQWYHSVRQQERTISINYWYDMEFDGHFVLHEFLRRVAEKKHLDEDGGKI
jgi:hypothetical protein